MTIFALFNNIDQAASALSELISAGFDPEDMNAIVLETIAKNYLDDLGLDLDQIKVRKTGEMGTQPANGLAFMIAGHQPVRIIDTGDVYASGSLARILVNTATVPSSAGGGLKAALKDFDIPEKAAETYLSGLKEGGVLFFIRPDQERTARAAQTLRGQSGAQVTQF